jgi:hypothetical protein
MEYLVAAVFLESKYRPDGMARLAGDRYRHSITRSFKCVGPSAAFPFAANSASTEEDRE